MDGQGPSSSVPAEVVGAWVNAFNLRDLGGMLNCIDADLDFHPLRLSGASGSYRGHKGLCLWFERFTPDPELQIDLADLHNARGGNVFAGGHLLLGPAKLAPYCAVHRVAAGRITYMHQYLSDLDTLERLAMTP
jgi:SnoaL-like domain